MTTGEKLKIDLGLLKFKIVKISRIVGMPIPFFIIFYNSRNTFPITNSYLRLIDDYFQINTGSNIKNDKDMYYTPIQDLEDFNRDTNGCYFATIDLVGYRYQNTNMFENIFNYKSNKLEEALYFKDLVKSAGMSNFTAKFRKERQKLMGMEVRLAKLIDCIVDKEDNSVIFRFLTPATEKYPKDYIFKTVNPITKELETNASKLYTMEIKILKFFDWLYTSPVIESVKESDIKDIFNIAEIQIWSDSPSFQYQGMNFNTSLIDGSIYKTDIKPKHWDKFHGEYAFVDKHIAGLMNSYKFFLNPMASMLTKKLRDMTILPIKNK